MCGIAGFVSVHPSFPSSASVLERMTSSIRHRGPDDFGFVSRDPFGVSLGHRRLSIVDLAGGHQPMPNEDRSAWIVYNGEVFNHSDLRPALERAGHRYTSHCDTETILHSYEESGPASLQQFRGMFAYAIWDERQRCLFAARDRLGIKPFYYYWDGGRIFAFASEIKALLEHPAISAEPEDDLLPEYLAFGYGSGERTLFRGIRKLMPGHHLTVRHLGDRLDLRIEQFWDVPESQPVEPRSDADWIHAVRQGLEETVRLRLMADVPLGTFLSGGLDSSAITALVGRQTSRPVKTFSVGYQEAQYSELAYATQVAQYLGTEHHQVIIGRDEFLSVLPRLIWHEDEPITWPSSVSLFFVSHLAAQHVKVVLTGEGADELFGGYERYRWNMLNTRAANAYGILPGGLRRGIRDWIGGTSLLRADLRRKISHSFIGRDHSVESLFLDNFYGAFALGEQQRLLASSPDRIYGHYLKYWNSRPQAPLLSRMLYADQKTYLVELLMKQDQMSMATSIESRVPFLDHQFLALAMSLPDRMKIRGAEQKYVLKKAVEDLLPHDIVYRKKMGFPTPLRQWFREPASAAMLDSLLHKDSFLAPRIDLSLVRTLLNRHRAGLEDGTDRLWRLLNLELWGQTFFGSRKDALLEPSAHLAAR